MYLMYCVAAVSLALRKTRNLFTSYHFWQPVREYRFGSLNNTALSLVQKGRKVEWKRKKHAKKQTRILKVMGVYTSDFILYTSKNKYIITKPKLHSDYPNKTKYIILTVRGPDIYLQILKYQQLTYVQKELLFPAWYQICRQNYFLHTLTVRCNVIQECPWDTKRSAFVK